MTSFNNLSLSSATSPSSVSMPDIEDLADFCHQWPQLRDRATRVLKGPNTTEREDLIHWLCELADRMHFSDLD